MVDMSDTLKLTGVVIETLRGNSYIVSIEGKHKLLAYLCGKMRQNFIVPIPGDKVELEVSPYDLTKGRIVRRLS